MFGQILSFPLGFPSLGHILAMFLSSGLIDDVVKSDNFTWKCTQPVNCETENCVCMMNVKRNK